MLKKKQNKLEILVKKAKYLNESKQTNTIYIALKQAPLIKNENKKL